MWIKEVVIDGFKSYAERTEIGEFDSQFNAITGLNGSGKSNILDSICFVLGISNLSQVRRCHLNVWVLVTLTSIPAVVAILYFSLQVCMHVYWGSVLASAKNGLLMLRTHPFPLLATGDSSPAVCRSRLDSRDRPARNPWNAVNFGAPEF